MTSGLVLKGSAPSGERGKVRWEQLQLDGNEVTRVLTQRERQSRLRRVSHSSKSEGDATRDLSGNVKVRTSEAVCSEQIMIRLSEDPNTLAAGNRVKVSRGSLSAVFRLGVTQEERCGPGCNQDLCLCSF